MLQKNYSNWAGFVAELDTVYKYSDNIYFYYSQSTLPGQTNQASILAQEIAFQTLISDGSPSGMNSYRQSGWPGSGAGSLPERGDTGNGYGCGYQPGETVFRYIFCGLNVDPIQYIDIPFVGYHWNGYNFCFEAEKKTESSKYVKLGEINEEWFAHNGWAYDESANLIYPTPEKIASYYPNYGKTIAQVCEEYNAKGMTILEPWGGQLFIPSEYNNVVIGEWFQIFDNYYGYRLKMPF